MLDTIHPAAIPAVLDGGPLLRITVLADDRGQAFDYETGNAGAGPVVAAVHRRLSRGQWSVLYGDEHGLPALLESMAASGLHPSPASRWPATGVYLWPADPSGNIAAGRWVLPCPPLAVQGGQDAGCDVSVTADNFPAVVAGYVDGPVSEWSPAALARFAALPDTGPAVPTPAPTSPSLPARPALPAEVDVRLPVLIEGAHSPSVAVVQRLVGGLADDGIFGPETRAGVERFQRDHGLTSDGVVGLHTWGALLGAPQ